MATVVLDTNVFLHSPNALNSFRKCDIVIPLVVIEELDNQKKRQDDAGRNARKAIKTIDKLQESGNMKLPHGVRVRIETRRTDLAHIIDLDENKVDNRIISLCIALTECGEKVTLISNDGACRVKARHFGIDAESFEQDRIEVDVDEVYSGTKEVFVPGKVVDELYKQGEIECLEEEEPFENQFIILKDECNPKHTALAKYTNGKFKALEHVNIKPWEITPRNVEQIFFLEALMDPKIQLVTGIGSAGTGKTLLAIASSMNQICDQGLYKKLVYYKSIVPIGPDMGALPGDMEEKLKPWMGSAYDAFEYLLGDEDQLQDLIESKKVELSSLTYIRGRSLPKLYMVIDECFPGNQYVATINGKETIRSIYNKFISGKEVPLVKTFNEITGKFEYKKVINAWNKGKRQLVQIKCGDRKLRCTENHPFLTERGWVRADQLLIGDLIKTSEPIYHKMSLALNDDQKQIVLGSYLGDGSLTKEGINQYTLRVAHGLDQNEYCQWKASMFGTQVENIGHNGYADKSAVRFSTKTFALSEDFDITKQSCPQWVLDELDERGLAIWFMDDGSVNKDGNGARIFTCSFDEDSQIRMVTKLQSMGIDCHYETHKEKYFDIYLSKNGYETLRYMIMPYIHSQMSYKIKFNPAEGLRFYGQSDSNTWACGVYSWDNHFKDHGYVVVKGIENLEQEEIVYDIEVEDNHNFIACSSGRGINKSIGGVIVHNCANLTPNEVKTIISRAGEGTKVVLIGDPYQIDHPYLDSQNNGLVYTVERFKGQKEYAHVTLKKAERSRLSGLAAELL